jgi:glycine cleavage system transcriptional repressor
MLVPIPRFALSAIGRDRPGIVAGVSGALLRHGANIEDSRMAILGGHFTMMLVVSAPEGADFAALRGDLEEARENLGLGALTLEEVSAEHGARPEASHMVTVYGADHPGIVHAVASTLAGAGVNVVDVATHLVAEEGSDPLYAMMMEVQLPGGLEPERLEADLREIADRESLDLSVRALEAEAL